MVQVLNLQDDGIQGFKIKDLAPITKDLGSETKDLGPKNQGPGT